MPELNNTKQRNKTQFQNEKAALECAVAGLPVFPVKVTRGPDGKKRAKPLVKWKAAATTDRAQIKTWSSKWPDAVFGVVTGSVFVVDLDKGDGKDGEAAYRALDLDPDDAAFVVRTPSGGFHLYFSGKGAEGLTISGSKIAPGLDTRGRGGFVFAPGAVSMFGEYKVERGSLALVQFDILDTVPKPIHNALAVEHSPNPDQPTAGGEDIGDLKDALHFIPNGGTHDEWTRILMALHHETDGSAHGRAIAHGWSAGYHGYDPKEVDLKWRSFGKRTDNPVTAETLFAEARANGWRSYTDDDLDDLDQDDQPPPSDPQIDALFGEDLEPWTDLAGLPFYTPDQLAARPPRDYTIKRLIAPGQIGCIFGDPGAGKSVIAPYVGYRVAQGEDVFGLDVKAGPVFYIAGEDFDGMGDRIKALQDDLGTTSDFFTGGMSDLFSEGVAGKDNSELKKLRRAVKLKKPKLIFIDTLAATMAGVEENDSKAMNRVVHIGRALAHEGAAVIFIHHGTKADGSTPRGHSVFNGALDFSIQVKPADQSGIVRGNVRKNRNGPPDHDIAFRIGSRVVGQYVDGQPIEAPICEPCEAGAADTGPRLSPSQAAALALVHEMMPVDDSGVVVDAWKAAARKGHGVTSAESADSRRRAVAQALTGLGRIGAITILENRIHLPESDLVGLLDDVEVESDDDT